jgi:Tol biopolymer transport system component/DNA-binding winged helix-turn-helix (wHTH) protein
MTSLPNPALVYEFGPFRLDPAERLLMRGGTPTPLAPKVIEILLLLVERRGSVVTKDELMTRLWPDTFVQESNLTQHIFMLRKALDDGGAPYIETVPRRGYRFAREVRSLAEPLEREQLLVSNRTKISVVTEEREISTPPLPASLTGTRTRRVAIGAAALVALVAGGIVLNRSTSPPKATAAPFARTAAPRLERLTTDSRSYEPAISPDGRFVAYQVSDSDHQTVWLRNIASGSAVQIQPPLAGGYSSLNFTRDGNELLYKTFRAKSDNGTVLRVPLFGGAPRQVATNVWSDFSLSPDGRKIAFLRANGALRYQLVTSSIEGGDERVIATLGDEQRWLEVANTSPSWSPDGQRLVVCGGWREPGRGWTFGIFEVPAPSEASTTPGDVKRVPSPLWNRVSQVAWLGDGSALVVVGRSQQRDPYQVWLLDYPSGQARRLTNDLHEYNKVRVSPDSKVIAVEQQIAFHHIWLADVDGDTVDSTSGARQITRGARSLDGYYGLSWTPDARLLFASSRTGESELFTSKPDGSELRQLTRDSTEWNTNGRMTSDGRFIVFSSGRNGEANIWRMDADGSNPVQLTRGKSEFSPTLSPDGQWVYYVNAHVAPSRIERVSIDGGAPRVIFDAAAAAVPIVSPDGKWLAFSYYSDPTGWRAAIIPVTGGPPRLFDWHGVRGFVRWSADSRALMFMKQQGNVSNVWMQPLDGGAPRALTKFEDQFIWNFAPSPDGKQLALSRGSSVSDIVLLRDFR